MSVKDHITPGAKCCLREAKPRPLDEPTRARVSATIKRVVKRHPKLARLLAK